MTTDTDVTELRHEVERLRAELATVTAERQRPAPDRHGSGGWLRAVSYALLLVLVAVLAPVSVVARWADEEVSSTDRFVALAAPLASDPAVQEAVTDRITAVVLDYVDVEALVGKAIDALSGSGVVDEQVITRIRSLAEPLSSALEGFVRSQIEKIVASDAFASAWESAVRAVHPQAVAVLTGEGSDLLDVKGGTVSVNLAPVIEKVKEALVQRGLGVADMIPQVNISFVVVSSDGVVEAQRGYALLQKLGLTLPLLAVVAFAAVIAVAPHRRRRRAAMSGALAVALGMLLLWAAIPIARWLCLDAIPDDVSVPAATAVFDTVVGALQPALVNVLLIALLAALVLWLSDDGLVAQKLRQGVDALRSLRRRHLSTGTVGHALWAGRLPIRLGVLAVAAVVIILSMPVTVGLVVAVAVSTAVVLLVAEVLATAPEPDVPEPDVPESDEAAPASQEPSPPVSTKV